MAVTAGVAQHDPALSWEWRDPRNPNAIQANHSPPHDGTAER